MLLSELFELNAKEVEFKTYFEIDVFYSSINYCEKITFADVSEAIKEYDKIISHRFYGNVTLYVILQPKVVKYSSFKLKSIIYQYLH